MQTEHIITPGVKSYSSEGKHPRVNGKAIKSAPKMSPEPFHNAQNANAEAKSATKQAFVSKQHRELLDSLLQVLKPFDVRVYLEIPEDDKVKVKHIIVAVIMKLLETAKQQQWNLAKVNDYVYIYNGQYWLQLEKDDLKYFLGECAIKMGVRAHDARHYAFKDDLFRQFLAEAHLPQPLSDDKKILINLQNGTYEFTKSGWQHRPFDPADFLTYILPFPFDELVDCPLFDRYLERVLPDESSRILLQEYSGYIFTKLNLEKMLMCTGSGANGKSVYFNVITALLGRQNVLTYSMGLFAHEYNRAKLTNVLLNYSSEKGTELNPDIFKALVSGEPLQAREPYGKSFTLYNRVRFIINANKNPRETEDTEAYFRRFLIIPFDVIIPESERDTELANKIIEQELAGVFNWLLQGVVRIVKNKAFTICEKSKEALNEFRKQSDSVALFIEEQSYECSEDLKITVRELYGNYKNFCNEDGYRAVSKNNFGGRVEKQGFERTRMNDGSSAFFMRRAIK